LEINGQLCIVSLYGIWILMHKGFYYPEQYKLTNNHDLGFTFERLTHNSYIHWNDWLFDNLL